MSDKIKFVISADASGSKVAFAEVTSGAQKLGTTIEQTSSKASISWGKVAKSAQALGGTVLALSALTAHANAESEASQARVETAFTNAGLKAEDYAVSLNKLGDAAVQLGFDDEDAADAVATFLGVTKDYGKAVQDLALAQDIARAKQMSLSSATALVAQIEAGRFRGLAMLGIAIDSTTTKEEALALAQERFGGSASAFAATSAGEFDRWRVEVGNAIESVGARLAGLEPEILAVSSSATLLGTVVPPIKEMAVAAGVTSASLGPIGLAAAALAAAGGIAYLILRTDEYTSAAEAATGATQDLTNFFAQIAQGLSPSAAKAMDDFNATLGQTLTQLGKTGDEAHDLLPGITELLSVFTRQGVNTASISDITDAFGDLTEAELQMIDANHNGIISFGELTEQISRLTNFSLAQPAIDAVTASVEALFNIPGIDQSKVESHILDLVSALNAGRITAPQFVSDIEDMNNHLELYTFANRDAAAAANGFAGAVDGASKAASAGIPILGSSAQMIRFHMEQSALGVQEQSRLARAFSLTGDSTNVYTDALRAAGNTGTDFIGVVDAQIAKLADYQRALGDTPALADTDTSRLAQGAQAAGSALATAFRIGVGNLQDVGSQSSAVDKWARELIGVKGEYAEIDRLLAKGTITIGEYNRAQSAQTSIFHNNAAIQRDLEKIQADQAPTIARSEKALKGYWDTIAAMKPDEQALTLAYMDSAESSKALTLQQLALSAATGELGASGKATAESMITAAAAADPSLQLLLTDMHLIKVNKDTGEITVDWSQVDSADSATQQLTESIDRLASDLEEIYHLTVDSSEASTANTRLQTTVDLLNALNGSSATFYVNQVSSGVSVGNPGGPSITPEANGGYVSAANGFAGHRDLLVGEFGPELIRRSGGGAFVLPTGASRSAMAMQSGPFQPVFNIYGANAEEVMRQLVPAIQLAARTYFSGHGL